MVLHARRHLRIGDFPGPGSAPASRDVHSGPSWSVHVGRPHGLPRACDASAPVPTTLEGPLADDVLHDLLELPDVARRADLPRPSMDTVWYYRTELYPSCAGRAPADSIAVSRVKQPESRGAPHSTSSLLGRCLGRAQHTRFSKGPKTWTFLAGLHQRHSGHPLFADLARSVRADEAGARSSPTTMCRRCVCHDIVKDQIDAIPRRVAWLRRRHAHHSCRSRTRGAASRSATT